ncbi:hypothetical protein E3P99_00360 [Wallemia hederae]|uniref:Dipeptidase n=1 Tax=Wallemia hederae TaxID=1540922 RepID=A0A4T0FVP5_9BASI|nr:hypothetical protein E3P99_00360 [Wallemia hederae]
MTSKSEFAQLPNPSPKAPIFSWGKLIKLALASLLLIPLIHCQFPREIASHFRDCVRGGKDTTPLGAAIDVLTKFPVLDSHLDLPIALREEFGLDFAAFNLTTPTPSPFPMHIDFQRTRKGHLGSASFSSFVECPSPDSADTSVRDTLEQLDTVFLLEEEYPDYIKIVRSAHELDTLSHRKLAVMLSLEGAHQLGDSLSALRLYARLGIKYLTLAHNCDNVFADAAVEGQRSNGGLSDVGRELVGELNRYGVLVDISHVSDETAHQAIDINKGPLFWSHSGARAIYDHPRNVPDDLLVRLRDNPNDGVLQVVVAAADFMGDSPSLRDAADHIEHIASVAGKAHVGIGSDFDGVPTTPEGLEDISTYPALFAELYKRGWTKAELAGLARKNFIRVLKKAESVSRSLKRTSAPSMAVPPTRHDLLNNRGQ